MSDERCSLLVVDDEESILATLTGLLSPEFEVLTADSAAAAQRFLTDRSIDLILTDQKMPGMRGVELLEWARQHSPRTIRLMMTGDAEMTETIAAINKGQVFRYLLKPWRHEDLLETLRGAAHTFLLERRNRRLVVELQELNEQLRGMNTELERRVAQRTRALEEAYMELEQKNKMLEKLALTDPLTNLPNRRAMDRLAERELRRRDRYPSALSITLIDVDHFKNINERYLLPGGDKVLVDLARALMGALRTIDFLGRIGGEEFMVIAPETDLQGAARLTERIRATVEKTCFHYKDDVIPVRVSLGAVVADAGTTADYDNMKHLAAAALSEAKKGGRNRCVLSSMPAFVVEAG